mmetsp:Transcript_71537/g.113838  ORF Transcript_71537/g.113838 Transcript_71537/m.113838 type:complete len:226 (-) Transcript_71537:343-1020(-)
MITSMADSALFIVGIIGHSHWCTNRTMKVPAFRAFILPYHRIELLLTNWTLPAMITGGLCINDIILFFIIICGILYTLTVTVSCRTGIGLDVLLLLVFLCVIFVLQTRSGTRDGQSSLLDHRHHLRHIAWIVHVSFVLAQKRFSGDLLHILAQFIDVFVHCFILRLQFVRLILMLSHDLLQRIGHRGHGHILLRNLAHFVPHIINEHLELFLFFLLLFSAVFLVK